MKQRISQLDENAVAREKAKTATAERKAQEQTNRADREEQRANVAVGGQSVGGSNGNADGLTNWDGTKKRGLGI